MPPASGDEKPDRARIGQPVAERLPEVLGVWAYGSLADGMARRDHDIDAAILGAAPLPLGWHEVARIGDLSARRKPAEELEPDGTREAAIVPNLQRACGQALDLAKLRPIIEQRLDALWAFSQAMLPAGTAAASGRQLVSRAALC